MTTTTVEPLTSALLAAPSKIAPEQTPGSPAVTLGPMPGRRGIAILRRSAWKSLAIAVFLLLWEFGPRYLVDDGTRTFLPPLHEDLQAGWRLFRNGQLAEHIQASLQRSVIGFAIALSVAVPLGLVLAWYPAVQSLLTPLLEAFRNTAALALLPVFTLLLGIGETSKISIVVYAAFFPILLNTIVGVQTVDPLLVRAARSLGLSSFRLFYKVVLPSAVPTIFTGVRMGGSASILVLIAAEMVGAKAGLGYLIVNAQSSFQITDMYAGIITVSVLGISVNYGLLRLERHFSRWRQQPTGI